MENKFKLLFDLKFSYLVKFVINSKIVKIKFSKLFTFGDIQKYFQFLI